MFFVCERRTNVVFHNQLKKLSSEYFMRIMCILGKYNHHKNHMLYQKNKKLYAFQWGIQKNMKTSYNKNIYTTGVALFDVGSGFESRHSRAL